MKRLYEEIVCYHLKNLRQMVLLVGPRQVGKTTLSLALRSTFHHLVYLNWDIPDDKKLITGEFSALEKWIGLDQAHEEPPVVIFDEIHKAPKWKNFIKGFFDAYEDQVRIVLTGSARLDLLRHMGDSLMGRYFLYRVHPLSVGEILRTEPVVGPIAPPKKVDRALMDRLLKHGGFPEPYLENSDLYSNRWRKERFQQLFHAELAEITRVRFIRDKSQREVDFVVIRDGKPWILVEVKLRSNHGLSKSLLHFSKTLEPAHIFQVVYEMESVEVDVFSHKKALIVPLSTFLSQLP